MSFGVPSALGTNGYARVFTEVRYEGVNGTGAVAV